MAPSDARPGVDTAGAAPNPDGPSTGTEPFTLLNRVERFRGRVIGVVSDEVTMPGGGTGVRDWVRHPGAVAAVALDDRGRVLLVRQYRHPAGRPLWELPAGLLDVAGEPALETVRRELAEEGDVRAARWHTLLDLLTTPGGSDEAMRVYLARDISPVPRPERHDRTDEEAVMTVVWTDLDAAVARALAGDIENAACVAGLLAAAHARDRDWAPLRPADAPWRARPQPR